MSRNVDVYSRGTNGIISVQRVKKRLKTISHIRFIYTAARTRSFDFNSYLTYCYTERLASRSGFCTEKIPKKKPRNINLTVFSSPTTGRGCLRRRTNTTVYNLEYPWKRRGDFAIFESSGSL